MSVISVDVSPLTFTLAGGRKSAPPHLKEPYDRRLVTSNFDEDNDTCHQFSYTIPAYARYTDKYEELVSADEAQSMLTRNGKYGGIFFNHNTTRIYVSAYNDLEDVNVGPQYMVFMFYHKYTPTVIVNYENYIQAFTLATDSPFAGARILIMPRHISPGGIGHNYYPNQHTEYDKGISDKRYFDLLTFTWSPEDEVDGDKFNYTR